MTIRVSESMREALKQLAFEEGLTLQAVLEAAVENYQRTVRLRKFNDSYARLSEAQMKGLHQELDMWERATVRDGLSPEDVDY